MGGATHFVLVLPRGFLYELCQGILLSCTTAVVISLSYNHTLYNRSVCDNQRMQQTNTLCLTNTSTLMHYVRQDFNKLAELLLIECSQAKRFLRTLFQVLLRMVRGLQTARLDVERQFCQHCRPFSCFVQLELTHIWRTIAQCAALQCKRHALRGLTGQGFRTLNCHSTALIACNAHVITFTSP